MLPVIDSVDRIKQWLRRYKIHQPEERIKGLEICLTFLTTRKERDHQLEKNIRLTLLEERARLAQRRSAKAKPDTTPSTKPGSATEDQANSTCKEASGDSSSTSSTPRKSTQTSTPSRRKGQPSSTTKATRQQSRKKAGTRSTKEETDNGSSEREPEN